MATTKEYDFYEIDYANYELNLCKQKDEILKQLETSTPKRVRKFNSYGTSWYLATPICGYYFYINGVMFEITNYVDWIGNFLRFLTQLAYFDNKPLMCAIDNEGVYNIMTTIPVKKDIIRLSIFKYVYMNSNIDLEINPMCDIIINKRVFIRQIYEFLQKISVDWINTEPEEQDHCDMEMIDNILKILDVYLNNPAEFKKTYDPRLHFRVFDIAYKDLNGEWKFILCYEEDERSNIEYWENLKQQNRILDFDFIEQRPQWCYIGLRCKDNKYEFKKREREDIKIYNDIVSRKQDKNWIYSTDTKNWYAANEVIPEPVSESKICEDFKLSCNINTKYCNEKKLITMYIDDRYLSCDLTIKSGEETIYAGDIDFHYIDEIRNFLTQAENGENIRYYDECGSQHRILVWQKENGYIRIMFLKTEEYCVRENIIYRFQEGYAGEDTVVADFIIKKDEFVTRFREELDKIQRKIDKVKRNQKDVKKQYFSIVEPDPKREGHCRIKDWCCVPQYDKLQDLKKALNSIKDYLIGKTLKKILFLGDLNDNEYVLNEYGVWVGRSRKTRENERTFWQGCEEIAHAPVVLSFGNSRLEVKVKGDERNNEHHVKLSYNYIDDLEEIEKEFPGVNHSVRFPNLIGQKLKEIKTGKKCNDLELIFENGYGCYIYDDWICSYGTCFRELTPEYYNQKKYTPLAYKTNENDNWRFQIFIFDHNEKDKSKKERIDRFIKDNEVQLYYVCQEYRLAPPKGMVKEWVTDILRVQHCNDWCYEPATDKWYFRDELMDEPQMPSEISDVEVIFNIKEEKLENDFKKYDFWEENIYAHFELTIKTKYQNFVLDEKYDHRIKIMLRKFINGIRNNQPVQISPYRGNNLILTAYPKEGNNIRITAFRNRFLDEDYEFDAIIPKDEFIKQLEKNMLLLRNRQKIINKKIKELNMKYLLKNGKVEFSGNKKQLIAYVKEHYKDEYWVRENGKKFDGDFGSFKMAIESIGLQLSDKMSNKEYNKTRRR